MFVYIFQAQIDLKKINSFLYGFLILFFLSPVLYSYVSLSQIDKRTDYPGKEIAVKVQITWDQNFDKEIEFVTGDEWKAGNLSYHLKSRPKWEGFTNNEILDKSPLAIRMLKGALNADCDGQAGLQQFAGDATMLFYMTEEAQEGRDAFKEKRKPKFNKFKRLP